MHDEHPETAGTARPGTEIELASRSSGPLFVHVESDAGQTLGSPHEERAEWQTLFEHMLDGFAYHRIVLDENGIPPTTSSLTLTRPSRSSRAFEKMRSLANGSGKCCLASRSRSSNG